MIRRLVPLIVFVCAASSQLPAQPVARFSDTLLRGVVYRNLGPFRAGAWLTDVAVPEAGRDHLYTFYLGTRNGGVWKTTNNGTTFEPIFDNHDVSSIGAVAVAPSNADVVWVWTPNQERGVFKTTDGGRSWTKSLFISDRVGVIDLVMNRREPDVLYAAAYEVGRKPWHLEEGGPGSAIYKTTDGGRSWKKLEGLPRTGKIGRIGIDIHQKNPDILYAIVENANPRPGRGLWVTDIGPLREMTPQVLDSALHLFDIEPRMPRGEPAWGNYRLYGDRYARTPNEPDAVTIEYYLKDAAGKAAITIVDFSGAVVRRLDGPAAAGMNRVLWNMLGESSPATGGGRGAADRPRLPPGDYVVTVSVGATTSRKPAKILAPSS
jgi:hypothetical protein